jgi:DNA-binding HxlR family transcriptional regulator
MPTNATPKTSPIEKLILIHLNPSPKTFAELLTSTESNPIYLTKVLLRMTHAGLIVRTGGRSDRTVPVYSLPTPDPTPLTAE